MSMMTSNALVTVSAVDEGDINRDQIVDGDSIPDEYFCPICQFLLWKPRSCSSCQQLFCAKCIRTWLENSNINRKCPYRCQPYIDRPCPPSVQSLLSHLNIHCRNATLGCTQILSYDRLEYHQNIECQYLSQRCIECNQLVLLSKLEEHQQIVGLCIPCPIKCTMCEDYIQKVDFHDHFNICRQRRIEQLNTMRFINQNMQRILNNQPIVRNDGLTFFEQVANNVQLIEQQKQMSRFPSSLKGVDRVQRAREQNCGYFYHTLIMLEFFILNWSKLPFFIYATAGGGLLAVSIIIVGIYIIFSSWIKRNIYSGSIWLILLTYVLTYGSSILLQFISDSIIIFCLTTGSFLLGCSSRLPLETYELDPLFNRSILSILICCLSLFVMKTILLLIRWYYWFIPIYLAMNLILLLNFYLTLKVYSPRESEGWTTTNRLTMPV